MIYKLSMHHDFVVRFDAKPRSYGLLRNLRGAMRCRAFFVRFASLGPLSSRIDAVKVSFRVLKPNE